MKKITKKTEKTVTPNIIVNCLDCETSTDVYKAYIEAKVRAKEPITQDEFEFAKNVAVNENSNTLVFVDCRSNVVSLKKAPWYKRMWRWFTHKK